MREEGSEFIDEPPGSYLRELRVGNWNVIWSVVNLIATLAVVIAGRPAQLGPDSSWWVLSKLTWTLLPVSCGMLFLVTTWLRLVGSQRDGWRFGLSIVPTFIALCLWISFRYLGGVSFFEAGS